MSQNLYPPMKLRDDTAVARDVLVRLLVTEAERSAWQAVADLRASGNLSEWIRLICNVAAQRPPTEAEMEQMISEGHMIPADAPGAAGVLKRFLAGQIKPKQPSKTVLKPKKGRRS